MGGISKSKSRSTQPSSPINGSYVLCKSHYKLRNSYPAFITLSTPDAPVVAYGLPCVLVDGIVFVEEFHASAEELVQCCHVAFAHFLFPSLLRPTLQAAEQTTLHCGQALHRLFITIILKRDSAQFKIMVLGKSRVGSLLTLKISDVLFEPKPH